MKNTSLLLWFWLIVTASFGQTNSFDGIYVGIQPISWTTIQGKIEYYTEPSRPKRKWYHLTYLKLQGDTVFADQSPINIYKKDTLYSPSEGAFYYYHGNLNRKDTTIEITLRLIFCDYCAIPEEDNPRFKLFPWVKKYTAKITKDGLLINGHLFRKTNKKRELISEHPEPFFQK